jgi:NADPH2:quinone reductase
MGEKAVVIETPGGAEQLKLVDVEVGAPGPGEIRIRHEACGLNYIDVYHRNGSYALPLPAPFGWAWRVPASSRRWVRASRT